MSKYIDVEPFENALMAVQKRSDVISIAEVLNTLMKYPAADVQEVRHGRWVIEKKMFPYIYPKWSCSECGEETTETTGWGTKPRYNYCPSCGAKMEELHDDND